MRPENLIYRVGTPIVVRSCCGYASAERLALLKLKEIHHKEEQQRKRKEETKQYLTAMNLMRRNKVSYPTPSKLASFLIQTNKINFYFSSSKIRFLYCQN